MEGRIVEIDDLKKWKEKFETEHKLWKNKLEAEQKSLLAIFNNNAYQIESRKTVGD